ncbi:MAG: hypothetical protein SOV55_02635 [Candidatus Borkfalkiaceae bacterium]|nr:chorion class high-cysteine HCB protein 13 [bacterium]MDY2850996.1 hypothetical protein [Christensenellaceae bacterium]
MMNCLCPGGNNCYLWILIILLVTCCGGGCLDGILDKLCNCECLLPLLLVWMCCCNKGGNGGTFGFGCGK